ncbi:MAG: YbjN domain-containing protein [Bacteroidia bacterium]|nr:YbjN domain-containing protein [Bacteroidia bacterium]MDW8236050.1 YbjN domain-containing protein [Bacteroidia bacterium]
MDTDIRRKLGRRIERFLKKTRLKYFTDSDGDYHIVLGIQEIAAHAHMIIMREGPMGEILSVIIRFDGALPKLSKQEALEKLNEWNISRRWPRMYLREDTYWGDFQLDAETDLPQKMLEQNLQHLILSSIQFLLYLTGKESHLLETVRKKLLSLLRLN